MSHRIGHCCVMVGLSIGAALLAAGCVRDSHAAAEKHARQAEQYLAIGKISEAVIEYRNAVQNDPRDGVLRTKLAEAYLRAGDAGKALEQYLRGADLQPDDPQTRLKAGTLLLLGGKFDDAKFWAEKVLAREPKNVPAQLLLASSLAGLKDLDGAVAQIEEAIRLDPDRSPSYANLGSFELGRGRTNAAEAAFKRAVELDEKSAPAHLALANFYWTQSRWEPAEQELLRAADLEPNDPLAHRALASFYLATRRTAAAEPHLKKVIELTNSADAKFALADYYTARNDEAAANEVLQPLAKDSSTAAAAIVRLAIAKYRTGRREAGYDELKPVLERDGTNLQALIAKTAFLAGDKRFEEALETITLASEKHKESAAALFWLGRVQAARHQLDAAIAAFEAVLRLNPRATDARVALANLHLSAGHAATSVGLARQVVENEPRNLAARLAVVRGLVAQRQFAAAQTELDVLLARAPNAAPVHVQLGVLSGLQHDTAGARRAFERARELDPSSNDALGGLVALDLAARLPADAKARVDEALAARPNDAATAMIAARTYAQMGEMQRSETLFRRVIQIDPNQFDAFSALGQVYIRQGRLDAALAEFDEIAQHDSRPVTALTFAGMILQAQGRTADARARFERALQIDPSAAVAANNLAWIYADSGHNLDLALELAQRAMAKMPEVAEVADTVGWVHFKNNRPAAAIPFFEKSAKRDAENPVYHYHLGLAYAAVGSTRQARISLERAIKLKPDFEGAADARRVLSTLAVERS